MTRFLYTLLPCALVMTAVAAVFLLLMPRLAARYRARTLYLAWLLVLAGFVVPIRPQPAQTALRIAVPAPRQITLPAPGEAAQA